MLSSAPCVGANDEDVARCVVQISNLGNVRLTDVTVEDVDSDCTVGTLAVGGRVNCTATRYVLFVAQRGSLHCMAVLDMVGKTCISNVLIDLHQ